MREAVISLSDADLEALGLEALVSECRAAGLRDFEEFACYGTGAIVQVEVAEPLDRTALGALDYVDRVERLPTDGAVERYLIAFTAPHLSGDIAEHAADLVGTCDPEVTGGEGATLSFAGPQAAIQGTVGEYEDAGLAPDLRQLGPYRGEAGPLAALTDRQREVVRTAFEMGYYEVPRTVSTREVAAELDLDASTVTEHLQRAERNLLGEHLEADR